MMVIENIARADTCEVEIKDIDDGPGPYCMSFGFDPDLLMDSIRRVGLINSPLVMKNVGKKLDIIIGYRRICALKSLGHDKVPCKIISASELSPLEGLLLNLHDNLSSRKFNAVEKGMVLNRLSAWVRKNDLLEHYMPLLDLPSHEPVLKDYLKIDRELNEEIRGSIGKGNLSPHTVKRFLEIGNDAKSSVFQLIKKLKFNVNQQRQLLEYLIDISNKDENSISDILNETTLKDICSDTRMNNPQKIDSILKRLRSRLFPRLTQAEKTFKGMVSSLDLPEGVRIRYPPFFEASSYRMEVFFKNGQELEEKIERLSRKKGFATLHDPWEKISHV